MKNLKTCLIISALMNIIALGFATKRCYYMVLAKNTEAIQYTFNRQSVYDLFPVTNSDIVFIGDSHIQMFALDEFLPGYKIKNRGIGGDITKGVYNRISELRGKPKKVFIEVGTNDIYNKIPIDSSMKYMSKIISHLKNTSPGTKIYIQSLLPRNEFSVVDYNKGLQEVCRGNGMAYINLYDSFSNNGSLNKKYDCGDGLHLNGQGYLLWSKLLKPYL